MKKVFSFSLLAAVMMIIMSACSGPSTPSDVAKQYGSYLMSEKFDKIADMVDIPDVSKEEAEEGKKFLVGMMQGAYEQMKEKNNGFKKFEVISESIDGDKAEVATKLIYGNGDEDESTLNFILKDGKWVMTLK